MQHLKICFVEVVPPEELRTMQRGVILFQDGLLIRKWSSHTDVGVEDPVFQVSVPFKFRDLVLQDSSWGCSGALGGKKDL